MRITLLGTGTSHGVPMIACDCAVCTSADPRDRRTRAGIHVQFGDRGILVDTTPELRLQCLACDIRRVDAVLFTHQHADHVAGLDDLRRFNHLLGGPLTCYGNRATLEALVRMFPYAFADMPDYPSAKPQLLTQLIDGEFEVCGLRVRPVSLLHGDLPVLGFRFGDFAYCTDCSRIPDEGFELLRGVRVLVLDALRRRPHPTHFNLDQAVAIAGRIGARQTYFTHVAHEMAHEATNAELPPGMALGFDGQVIVMGD